MALLAVAWLAPGLPQAWLALLFVLVSFGMGCSYPVSQITVQVAAGPARLGAAAGSVQFSRTLGAAIATTLLGALLFGTLAAGDPEVAALFARLVREGPALLPGLAEADRAALREGLTGAFRAAFGGAALLAASGQLAGLAGARAADLSTFAGCLPTVPYRTAAGGPDVVGLPPGRGGVTDAMATQSSPPDLGPPSGCRVLRWMRCRRRCCSASPAWPPAPGAGCCTATGATAAVPAAFLMVGLAGGAGQHRRLRLQPHLRRPAAALRRQRRCNRSR